MTRKSAAMLQDTAIKEPLYAHAMTWFPKECCGLLLTGPQGDEVVLAENLADKYHDLDPQAYPRTAERAFVLDPMLIHKAEQAGKSLVAIVHSHCIVGAYFSDEDILQATSPFEDGPLYPGVDYVVLDAQEAGVVGFKTYAWGPAEANDTGDGFQEV